MVPIYHNLNWICNILGYDPEDDEDITDVMSLIEQGILKQDSRFPATSMIQVEEASVYRWLRKRSEIQTKEITDRLDAILEVLKRLTVITTEVYKVNLIGHSDSVKAPITGGEKTKHRLKAWGLSPIVPLPCESLKDATTPISFYRYQKWLSSKN